MENWPIGHLANMEGNRRASAPPDLHAFHEHGQWVARRSHCTAALGAPIVEGAGLSANDPYSKALPKAAGAVRKLFSWFGGAAKGISNCVAKVLVPGRPHEVQAIATEDPTQQISDAAASAAAGPKSHAPPFEPTKARLVAGQRRRRMPFIRGVSKPCSAMRALLQGKLAAKAMSVRGDPAVVPNSPGADQSSDECSSVEGALSDSAASCSITSSSLSSSSSDEGEDEGNASHSTHRVATAPPMSTPPENLQSGSFGCDVCCSFTPRAQASCDAQQPCSPRSPLTCCPSTSPPITPSTPSTVSNTSSLPSTPLSLPSTPSTLALATSPPLEASSSVPASPISHTGEGISKKGGAVPDANAAASKGSWDFVSCSQRLQQGLVAAKGFVKQVKNQQDQLVKDKEHYERNVEKLQCQQDVLQYKVDAGAPAARRVGSSAVISPAQQQQWQNDTEALLAPVRALLPRRPTKEEVQAMGQGALARTQSWLFSEVDGQIEVIQAVHAKVQQLTADIQHLQHAAEQLMQGNLRLKAQLA